MQSNARLAGTSRNHALGARRWLGIILHHGNPREELGKWKSFDRLRAIM